MELEEFVVDRPLELELDHVDRVVRLVGEERVVAEDDSVFGIYPITR